jgi:flavin prenyltransferase
MKRIVLAITGASGTRYGRRLLQVLTRHPAALAEPVVVDLVVSSGARLVLSVEESIDVGDAGQPVDPARLLADQVDLVDLGGPEPGGPEPGSVLAAGAVTVHDPSNLAAPIASGSTLVDAMVILPCSMATLGAVASGAGRNLIHRAADVTLKERRPLVLCPRETPVSVIHLRNMVRLAEAGACILPCAPGFTHRPTNLAELVDGLVMRVCDQLGLHIPLCPRWDG